MSVRARNWVSAAQTTCTVHTVAGRWRSNERACPRNRSLAAALLLAPLRFAHRALHGTTPCSPDGSARRPLRDGSMESWTDGSCSKYPYPELGRAMRKYCRVHLARASTRGLRVASLTALSHSKHTAVRFERGTASVPQYKVLSKRDCAQKATARRQTPSTRSYKR